MPFLNGNLSLRKWKNRFGSEDSKSSQPETTRGLSAPPELESGPPRPQGEYPIVKQYSENTQEQSPKQFDHDMKKKNSVKMPEPVPEQPNLAIQMPVPIVMPVPQITEQTGESNPTLLESTKKAEAAHAAIPITPVDPVQTLVATGVAARVQAGPAVAKRSSALNKIAGPSEAAQIIGRTVDVNAAMQAVESGLRTFMEDIPWLMKGLDEVARIHPAVTVAVLAFKAVYTMELTRRENDKRIKSLYVEMKDMMAILIQLRDVKDPKDIGPDGTPMDARLLSIAQNTADDIKDCANTCDTYAKKRLVVKVLKAPIWESRLVDFVGKFTKRRAQFEEALAIHTARIVDTIQTSVYVLKTKMDSMDAKLALFNQMFQKFISADESKISEKLKGKGDVKAVQKNDALLRELNDFENGLSVGTTERNSKRSAFSMKDLRDELNEDFEQAIKQNLESFEGKFVLYQKQLKQELSKFIRDENDRLLVAVKEGPHDRIKNESLREIWKEMSWRRNVKAKLFVLTLRDHFRDQLYDVKSPSSKPDTGDASDDEDRGTDDWAFQFLGLNWLPAIMEAFDEDGSGYITVAELNRFTETLPRDLGWSLQHWIAYWAVGWEISCVYYANKIHKIFHAMFNMRSHILSHNRYWTEYYLDLVWPVAAELILALRRRELPDLEHKFLPYFLKEEERLKRNLQDIRYDIDALDTVHVVAGPGRIETHMLPLIYLLMKRDLQLFRMATKVKLGEDELWDSADSIVWVQRAVEYRVEDLQNRFKQQQLDLTEQFKTVACGMLLYIHDGALLWELSKLQTSPFLDLDAYRGSPFWGDEIFADDPDVEPQPSVGPGSEQLGGAESDAASKQTEEPVHNEESSIDPDPEVPFVPPHIEDTQRATPADTTPKDEAGDVGAPTLDDDHGEQREDQSHHSSSSGRSTPIALRVVAWSVNKPGSSRASSPVSGYWDRRPVPSHKTADSLKRHLNYPLWDKPEFDLKSYDLPQYEKTQADEDASELLQHILGQWNGYLYTESEFPWAVMWQFNFHAAQDEPAQGDADPGQEDIAMQGISHSEREGAPVVALKNGMAEATDTENTSDDTLGDTQITTGSLEPALANVADATHSSVSESPVTPLPLDLPAPLDLASLPPLPPSRGSTFLSSSPSSRASLSLSELPPLPSSRSTSYRSLQSYQSRAPSTVLSAASTGPRFEAKGRDFDGNEVHVTGRCYRNDEGLICVNFTLAFTAGTYANDYWSGHIDESGSLIGYKGASFRPNEYDHEQLFILRRIPSYLMTLRPSPFELLDNRPRSLWQFATSAVLYEVRKKSWSWSFFQERRRNRQRYILLNIACWTYGRRPEGEEFGEFLRMRKAILPEDGNLVRSQRDLVKDMMPNHFDLRCASCDGTVGIQRIMCLDCRPEGARIRQTVNFCDLSICGEKTITSEMWGVLDQKKPHLPTHDIAKLRNVLHLKDMPSFDRRAQEALERCRSLIENSVRPASVDTVIDGEILHERRPILQESTKVPDEGDEGPQILAMEPAPEGGIQSTTADVQDPPADDLGHASAPDVPSEEPRASGDQEDPSPVQELGVAEPSIVVPHVPTCYTCRKSVSQPCWYCMDCGVEDVFLCDECEAGHKLPCRNCDNAYVQPFLRFYYGEGETDDHLCNTCVAKGVPTLGYRLFRHIFTHDLVRCKKYVEDPEPPVPPTSDERFAALETRVGDIDSKLDKLQNKIESMFARMEQLLLSSLPTHPEAPAQDQKKTVE